MKTLILQGNNTLLREIYLRPYVSFNSMLNKERLSFQSNGEKLSHLMTFVLVFMGSPERMKNPHLRARMAEALEALMPPKDQSQTSLVMAQ